jgi:hypothetical protein
MKLAQWLPVVLQEEMDSQLTAKSKVVGKVASSIIGTAGAKGVEVRNLQP